MRGHARRVTRDSPAHGAAPFVTDWHSVASVVGLSYRVDAALVRGGDPVFQLVEGTIAHS
jgi:hypothetical protein